MKQEKLKNPPKWQRNSVVWLNAKGKPDMRNTFIREHSTKYPKPAWPGGKNGVVTIVLTIWFCVCLALLVVFFRENIVSNFVLLCLYAIPFVLNAISLFKAELRVWRFHKELFLSGGKIVDPWNTKIAKERKRLAVTLLIVSIIVVFTYPVLMLIVIIFDVHTYENPGSFQLLYPIWLVFCSVYFSYTYQTSSPFIFMDIEVGMLFGGALFSYDKLRDIRPTGKDSAYELYYDGALVAKVQMLPSDMAHLRELLALQDRYGE